MIDLLKLRQCQLWYLVESQKVLSVAEAFFLDIMFFNVLSSASKTCLCIIDVFSISSANIIPGLMLQSLSSVSFKEILKRECAVLPLGSNNAAISEEATDRTILCWEEPSRIISLCDYLLGAEPCTSTELFDN